MNEDPSQLVCEAPRYHALSEEPDPGEVWRYTPRDGARLSREVCRVCSNGSFVSRVLRVITRDGESKNFEEITGQDGLTFGITDFAGNEGCCDFFRALKKRYPDVFAAAFGEEGQKLLDQEWVTAHNGGGKAEGNNRGLIRFPFVRRGLAVVLADRRLFGFQLAHFVRGKVTPAVRLFTEHGLKRELTLAALICIANSFGAGGMRRKFLEPALARTAEMKDEGARERALLQDMLSAYVAREVERHPRTEALLRRAFGQEEGDLPGEGQLGHRGRRVLKLLEVFPVDAADPFGGIGRFALEALECDPDEPACCLPPAAST
jgi:hypothetical protein